MSHEPPEWRKAFDAVEGRLGPRLQAGVEHELFADAVSLVG